jgi:hypothetical protein
MPEEVKIATPAAETATPAVTTPVETAKAPEAPAAVPAPAVEAPKPDGLPPEKAVAAEPAKAAAPAPSPAPTLLSATQPEKPADQPAKPEAPATAEPPAKPEGPPVKYEAFKLPEGFTPDEKEMTTFTDILRDGKASQEMGQKLVDLYVGEVQRFHTWQREQWQKTLTTWKEDVMADPQFGGNRFNTVLNRSIGVLNEFATKEFRDMLDMTGLGNHVEMFRFLSKIADFVGEPGLRGSAEAMPPNIKPSRAERRYGKNGQGAQSTG